MVPFMIIYIALIIVAGGLILWSHHKNHLWICVVLTIVGVWVLGNMSKDAILYFTHQEKQVTGTFTRIESHFYGEFDKVYVYNGGDEVDQLYFIHQPSVKSLEGSKIIVNYLPFTSYGVGMKEAPIQQPLK